MEPFVILIAGIPRSGSTWLFNATRLVVKEGGRSVHAAWHSDYDPSNAACVHVVKVHRPKEVFFPYSIVMTNKRDLIDCVQSISRMRNEPVHYEQIRAQAKHLQHLYQHWKKRSSLEVDFDMIINEPEQTIMEIASKINMSMDFEAARRIAQEINNLDPPKFGSYDKETLLHPRHRYSGDDSRTANAVKFDRLRDEQNDWR